MWKKLHLWDFLNEQLKDKLKEPGEDEAWDKAGGERKYPGHYNLTAHAPVYGRETACGTHTHYSRANGVGGGKRYPEAGSKQDRSAGGGLGCKAINRFQFSDVDTHGTDDAPTPQSRADCHYSPTEEYYPEWHLKAGEDTTQE